MLILPRNLALLIALVILSGCTHTRALNLPPGTSTLHEINKQAQSSTTTVTLSTGEQAVAQQLHLAPDVATWVTEEGGVRSVPLSEVAVVEFKSAGRGAMDGLKIGVSIGAAAAALALVTTPPCDSNLCFGPGFMAAAAGISVGGAASLAGLIVGGLKRGSTIYAVAEAEIDAPQEPAPARIAISPSGKAHRLLSNDQQERMLRRLRALQGALAYESGTEELRQAVAEAQSRAEEGYLRHDELPRLVGLFQQYRID